MRSGMPDRWASGDCDGAFGQTSRSSAAGRRQLHRNWHNRISREFIRGLPKSPNRRDLPTGTLIIYLAFASWLVLDHQVFRADGHGVRSFWAVPRRRKSPAQSSFDGSRKASHTRRRSDAPLGATANRICSSSRLQASIRHSVGANRSARAARFSKTLRGLPPMMLLMSRSAGHACHAAVFAATIKGARRFGTAVSISLRAPRVYSDAQDRRPILHPVG